MHFVSRAGLAALVAVTVAATPAAAVPTQGSLGDTSTGVINISASVPSRVRISGLSDINFGSLEPTSTARRNQSVCVWSNSSTRGYKITALGSGAGNAFELGGTGLTAVPYSVEWAASSGQTTGTSLTAGSPSGGLVSTAVTSACNAGPSSSASLIVSLSSSTLESMTADAAYTGALTLVVAPE